MFVKAEMACDKKRAFIACQGSIIEEKCEKKRVVALTNPILGTEKPPPKPYGY